jgi:hypothetical protein
MDVNLNLIKSESYCMAEDFNFCDVTNPYSCFTFLDIYHNQ